MLCPTERLVLGVASGVGNLAVLLGSRTGRDGIGGVSVLASAGFAGEDGAASLDEAKRPSVQVGDPYEEKRLIEACLALLDEGLVVGIQDLGGAGLVCATSETAARGRVGMDVDVTAVPLRESGMAPYEIMTSESQERMLAIITPENLEVVKALCDKWEVRASVVGRVVEPEVGDDGVARAMLRIRDGFDGEILANVPAAALADDAPLYDRPHERPASLDAVWADDPTHDEPTGSANDDLLDLSGGPGLGLSPVRLAAVLEHGRGSGARRRALAPRGTGPTRLEQGHCPLDRLESALVRARSATRHGLQRRRRGGELGLRRSDRQGGRELSELRQPRAPRGDVAAHRVDRRNGRRLVRASACRSLAATCRSTTKVAGATSTPHP